MPVPGLDALNYFPVLYSYTKILIKSSKEKRSLISLDVAWVWHRGEKSNCPYAKFTH